ncbi:Flp family type IVb pilin [Arthrobacter sp. R4-81]
MARRREKIQPRQRWLQLLLDEHGTTATEYSLLMSFIVMIVIVGITFFGLELLGWYDELTAHLKLVLGIP